MRVSAAGNMPLQGLVKPPAKPVVMIAFTQTYDDLQGHGSRLEVILPCLVCFFKAHMIYIS